MTRRIAGAIVVALLLFAGAYAVNVALGLHAVARSSGTLSGLGVWQPVTILRDARGVPHIAARNEHDAFFAEGFVEASDRLFQMDITRRFVEGRLAEIFGPSLLASDERERTLPVEQLAQIQWERLPLHEQEELQAFADGVNAAMRVQPLPPEFRMLLYKPQSWRPQDSLVTSFGIVMTLTDDWSDILGRDNPRGNKVAHPLTDPCYDAPVLEGLAHISDAPHCTPLVAMLRLPPEAGSNAWATGAAHTTTDRALLANDPHLPPGMPGVWYLVDLRYPGFHAAGATFAGLPGIILGHNDFVAWGATNGSVAAMSVFDAPLRVDPSEWTTETFHVRFGLPVTKKYYRGVREFGVQRQNGRLFLVRWDGYDDPASQLPTFDALDRARSITDALRALRSYPGPTLNFVVADTSGRAAYQLAGDIPDDPAWARHVHRAADLSQNYPNVPFEKLPHIAQSRNAIVWTANNEMYGRGYPYRLSPEFSPPYRAYRIAQLLKARSRYDIAYFERMQMDTLSLPELELARLFGLQGWDGHFTPASLAATKIYDARVAKVRGTQAFMAFLMRARFAGTAARRVSVPLPTIRPWGIAGAMTPQHPFASFGIKVLNGTTFPGDGDDFTIHVQTPELAQSFRAVWDVGNWDAGGISIPEGESGEPGSPHYTGEAAAWIAGALQPLPYSKAAVEAAARERLTLLP